MRKFWTYRTSKSAIVNRVLNKMLHLRYSAGFLICFDFRIYQSSECTRFLNMSGLYKFWIKYFMIDVWQYSEYDLDSEYATVANMLGSHKVVNEIFHHKYLTGFWICLDFWKYQCYTGFCRKQPVIHVWQVSEHSLGSQSARAWICKSRECAKVTHDFA